MGRWWGLCALAMAAGASARTGFEARCEAEVGRPSSELVAKSTGYSVDNSVSYLALTQMQKAAPGQQFVLGLTRTESHVSINSTGRILADGKRGRECMAPRLDVQLWYSPIVIYVGSEFAPGTCAYNAILAHEKRHMAAYLAHLDAVERTLRAELAARLGDKPVYAARGEAFAALGRELDATWLPHIKAELAKAEQAHAGIDTPEEYARLSKVCEGEVQSIMGKGAPGARGRKQQ